VSCGLCAVLRFWQNDEARWSRTRVAMVEMIGKHIMEITSHISY
jgi:hypothetical protein